MIPNVYQQYKQQSVLTMTPGEVIVKLYDEFTAHIRRGMALSKVGKQLEASQELLRCRQIIGVLNTALNDKYEISSNLEALYEFFDRTIAAAAMNGDMSLIGEIEGMVVELRDSFAQAEKTIRSGNTHSMAVGI